MNPKHGEDNYYLTQMLSSHGCYRVYLHRFRHDELPECSVWYRVPEDTEHVFFWCPRFAAEKGTGGATRIITYFRDHRGTVARDGGKLDCGQQFRAQPL